MGRTPTMQDIAELAGVSKSTVSRALADDPRVSEKTKAEIRAIAAKLRYQPNTMASGLARKRSHILGLVIPESPRSISDPFYLEFIGGVGDYAITRGYSLLFSTFRPSGLDEAGHILLAENNRVDGLILTEPLVKDDRISYLKERSIPFIFLGKSGDSPDLLWVNGDNVEGAKTGTEHLIQRGHTQIACIAGSQRLMHGVERLTGYKKALQDAGIALDHDLIKEADFTEESGYRAMAELLSLSPRPTAAFACNDLMAIGAIGAIQAAGLQVPDDIAVVGFDGIRLGQYTSPSLTTISQPIYQMGFAAAEMLIKTILGESIDEPHLSIPLDLVIRASS